MTSALCKGGYVSWKADPDVWIRPMTKPNGDTYSKYALCYDNDTLMLTHMPKEEMDIIPLKYELEDGSVNEPGSYLGADISRWKLDGSCDTTKVRAGRCRLKQILSARSLKYSASYCKLRMTLN